MNASSNHRTLAMALLISGAPLKPREGQFLGGIAFDEAPLTEKQARWLGILVERHSQPAHKPSGHGLSPAALSFLEFADVARNTDVPDRPDPRWVYAIREFAEVVVELRPLMTTMQYAVVLDVAVLMLDPALQEVGAAQLGAELLDRIRGGAA
jgi:hypothetical protein